MAKAEFELGAPVMFPIRDLDPVRGLIIEELVLHFCKWDAFRGGDEIKRRKSGGVLVCNL